MTGEQIIRAVLAERGIGVRVFFGLNRYIDVMEARYEAARRLHEAGFGTGMSAKLMKRDRKTMRHWRSAEFRERRRARYVKTGPSSDQYKWKTTPQQRAQLLALHASDDRRAIRAVEISLGLCKGYTNKVAHRLTARELPLKAPIRDTLSMTCRPSGIAGSLS